MKLLAKILLSLSLLASASAQTNQAGPASGSGVAQASGSQSIRITRNGSQLSRQGPAENFTGTVRVVPLFQANASLHATGSLVTFESGARTAWHTHPLGQILILTAGTGRVQRWGDPVDEIRQGDVVYISPDQKHWHGAAPGSSMAHMAITNRNVRAIVSYEPGFDFPFPEGEVPPPMTLGGRALSAVTVPQSEFMQLTKIPIIIYYGDNIPEKPSVNPGQEQWRIFLEMAKKWRDAVNKRGGNVTLVHLPEIGIRGNTHFPMSDMNNREIADLMSKFLKEKGLD